ncbi:hypothetical protein L226DRAFT_613841 [Lentinus tigrinus ALCF2SS1-7]|uniref:HNH nuclease domain-containing protein n=1 Tax=Lentinus tigrinus ALCF2SS1-6 TaxID=1328759 RepID=A0A5C2RQI9_9APHY|nr:hypothetical protein L227DRAFT_581235 [Lentinus tigrinus ALCF2SS1-6]RPD73693.1 hypothetical protein L226DRAFT_613841 [Lentinus tigrinus ALCF2SS1-7]
MSLASRFPAQSLPENPYLAQDEIHTAYAHCLGLESLPGWNFSGGLQDASFNVLQDMAPTVSARVLGHGLRLAPDDAARNVLARDILACQEDQELLAGLAHLYVFGLIRVFYNPNGPTPAATPSSTPPETAAQEPPLSIPSSSSPAVLRDLLMLRDGYRCAFTGSLSLEEFLQNGSDYDPSAPLALDQDLNVAHIISHPLSETTSAITPAVRAKFEWATTLGAIVEHFGGLTAHCDMLGEGNLHSPKNSFISTHRPHLAFDMLDLYLLPAKNAQQEVIPDTYEAIYAYGPALASRLRLDLQSQVVFRSYSVDGEVIPAPDPKIIALHAACAQIAHMSGVAECLGELYRGMDAIAVMTHPKAPYELSRALKTLQIVSAMT